MFWFIFILIILFIIFLIVLLISSSQVTLSRPRAKSKVRQKKEPKKKKAIAETKTKVTAVIPTEEESPAVIEPEAPVIVPTPLSEPVVKAVPEPEVVVEEKEVIAEISEFEPFIIEDEYDEPEVDTVPEVKITPEPIVEDTYHYDTFDNTRTMEEFGLSREEANDFILDLIQQVKEELVNLESAVAVHDTKKIEDISHMIKGSATNLGTGGIADVLVDFNTYMKSANEPEVVAMHMRNLHRAYNELKSQFS